MFTTVKKASLAEIEIFLSRQEAIPLRISRFRDQEGVYPILLDVKHPEPVDPLEVMDHVTIRDAEILLDHSAVGMYLQCVFNNYPEVMHELMGNVTELIILDDP